MVFAGLSYSEALGWEEDLHGEGHAGWFTLCF